MAIIFPDNPINGQTTFTGGNFWGWDGERWFIIPNTAGYTGSIGAQGPQGPSGGYTGSAGAGRPVASQIFAGTGNAAYSLDRVLTNPLQVMVMVNGLVQLPVVDYSVSGSTLTFAAGSIPNTVSDIEVLYFNDTPAVGYQGSVGFFGSSGFTGSAGQSGFSGSKGFNGSIGQTGFTGSFGIVGYTGSFGYTGSQGIQGIPGQAADKGFTGSKGDPGPAGGYTGSVGSGFTGSKGDLGYTGSQGIQGNIGYVGSSGASVYQGFTGSRGELGFTGSVGQVGAPDYSQKIISTGVAAYLLDRIVLNANHIIVSVNGLVQVPDNDYQVNGTSITFTNPPNSSSDIEIRYFSISTIAGFRGSTGYRGSLGDSGYKGSVGVSGIANVYIGPSADPNPFDGELWFDTDNGILSIYSQSSGTWVGIGPGLRGASGYTGSANGPIGFTGSAGLGYVGSSGLGYTGSIGAGYTGSAGAGYTGSTGNTGPMGPAGPGGGYTGSKGDMGPAGLGYTGSAGATGPVGPLGYSGSTGIGFTGSAGGPLGYTGSSGAIGYTGSSGTGGGAGLGSRQTITVVGPYTSSVLTGSVAAAKTYVLYNVTVNSSHNVWIRIYDSSAALAADAGRTIGQDPGYNSGVIAELISSSGTTATTKFTPGVIGMNNNPILSNLLYYRVTDLSGTAASVNMTLSILQLEV